MNAGAEMSRRAVLGAGLGLAGVALIAGSGGFALLRLSRPDHLAAASYLPLVGSGFRVGGYAFALELTAVRLLGGVSRGQALMAGREHFALDFSGPADQRLSSSQHPLSHPELGSFQLFLSPVGQPGSLQQYEAIVNRSETKFGGR